MKEGAIIEVKKDGRKYVATHNGVDVSNEIDLEIRKQAEEADMNLEHIKGEFKQVNKLKTEKVNMEETKSIEFVKDSYKLKPKDLVMNELKWKYLVRNVVKGKNILMTGMAGAGKTVAGKAVAKVMDRPFFYFNLGATQDPRSSLIGNTFFSKDEGTYFGESAFIKAIRTPDAVILLDELSRAHPEAWNILMTVLDEGQRYLRLDEKNGQELVKVAEGVSFIATANIGNEYTSTRVFDRALMDRFAVIEMDLLDNKQEKELLTMLFPSVDEKSLEALSNIAHELRKEWMSASAKIGTAMSTRMSVQVAEMLGDGFALLEAFEVTLLPLFDQAGGESSERNFVKQMIQKYIKVDGDEKKDLFNKDAKISPDNPFM